MINTRILEQRLGWKVPQDGSDEAPAPPSRPIAHAPMLQGRVSATRSGMPRARRAGGDTGWSDVPVVMNSPDRLAAKGSAPPFSRGTVGGTAMDQLRTQLLRVVADKGWRRIGVTSARRGAGRSFVAAGLAVSIARLETQRVLLVDGDLAEPGLADMLDLTAPGPLDDILSGTRNALSQLVRAGDSMALALNAVPVQQPGERMYAPDAIHHWREMLDCAMPDVVILDLPPLLEDAVMPALMPQLDAVLLVADGLSSTARDILECERILDGQVPLLGIVLNKSEDRDPRRSPRRR
ncbi:MAG: CpsD/CapB family tyrosine-protein kinase [Rhodobacter sp.]|nr:CpsD/CapB family tyrosine-protein kinase [Paracoccaceae bacterium]MCC0081150.1 CpsD/CapB family tyrosine-protein kinase [Rhodobacter sp.]